MPDEVVCDLLDTALQYHVSSKIQGNFGVHICVNTVEQGVSPGRPTVGKKASGHLGTSKVSVIWKETMEKSTGGIAERAPSALRKNENNKACSVY